MNKPIDVCADDSVLPRRQLGGVVELTLNRPRVRNAINTELWQALAEQFARLAEDDSVDVVVLRGAGGAFSAGADIGELRAHINDRHWMANNQALIQSVNKALVALPKVTLAAIDGACVGGGLGLAVACDLRFSTERSKFALTPARLGLSYSLADTKRLVDLIGDARARELLLTGRVLDASTASRYGLLTEVTAGEQLDDAVAACANAIANNSSNALALIKRTLGRIRGGQTDDDELTRAEFAAAFEHDDFKTAADAFLSVTAPDQEGKA